MLPHSPFAHALSRLLSIFAIHRGQVQARYIVERMEPALWGKVLDEENPFRRQLIDQARARPVACPAYWTGLGIWRGAARFAAGC